MGRVGKLSNKHGCGGVFETETEANNSTSNCEHDESVGERLKENPENDDHRADDYGELPPNLLDKPPEEKLGDNTTESLRSVENTELGASGIVKVPEFVSRQVLQHGR